MWKKVFIGWHNVSLPWHSKCWYHKSVRGFHPKSEINFNSENSTDTYQIMAFTGLIKVCRSPYCMKRKKLLRRVPHSPIRGCTDQAKDIGWWFFWSQKLVSFIGLATEIENVAVSINMKISWVFEDILTNSNDASPEIQETEVFLDLDHYLLLIISKVHAF